MKFEKNGKLITCITPKGKAMAIEKLLQKEKGINSVNIASGRGGGRRGRIEVDILTVVVSAERADEIFEFIYYSADIGEYHGGFMHQGALTGATPFELPEIPEEPDNK